MFGLINEANFFVVFIALLIIAFMLGLIFGTVFNKQGNDTQEARNNKDKSKNSKETPQWSNPIEQRYNEKHNDPPQRQDQMSRDQTSQDQISQDRMSQGRMSRNQMSKDQMSRNQMPRDQMSRNQMSRDQKHRYYD